MSEIIPAIIALTQGDLEDKMATCERLVPLVQIDVLDGSMTKVRSWPYQSPTKSDDFFEAVINEDQGFPFWQSLEFEAHLMVRNPELFVDHWISAGASRIIVQIEGVSDFQKCVDAVGGRVPIGVALALDTPVDVLKDIAKDITIIQSMGWNLSNLGIQGRPFDQKTIERVKQLHTMYPEHVISVDGGVNLENASELLDAGVERLVVGSALWENSSVRDNLAQFKKI